MAMLTRFVSSSPVTPAINRVNIDPGAASMAARSAVEGTSRMAAADQQVAGSIQHALDTLGKSIQATQDKVDDGYLTHAKANIEVDYNDAYNKSLGNVQPGGTFDKDTYQLFQTTASPWVENAPNDVTRQKLVNSLSSMAVSGIKRAQNLQYQVNSDQEFVRMADYAAKAPMMAMSDPASHNQALDRIDEMGMSMKQQGIDARRVDAAVRKNKMQVNEAVTMQLAEKDPFRMLDAIGKGEVEGIDAAGLARANVRAKATINGYVKAATDNLQNLSTQITAGQALPDNAVTLLDQAAGLAKRTQDPKLATEVARTAQISEISKGLTSASYQDLKAKQAELTTQTAQSRNPDMKLSKLQETLLNNRIKVIEQDPLSYGLIQDKGMKLPDLPDPTVQLNNPQDEQAWLQNAQMAMNQRAMYSDQYSEMLGIPVPVTRQHELDAIAQKFSSLTPKQQEMQLKVLAMGGDDQAGIIADRLAPLISKKDGDKFKALAPTIALMGKDPKMASEVLKGQQLMASNQVKFNLKPQDILDSVSATYGNLFSEDPKRAEQFVEAAKALTASQISQKSRGGEFTDLLDQKDAFQENLMRVSNAVKVTQGGTSNMFGFGSDQYSTIAPKWGMDANGMADAIAGLDNDSLVKFGNGVPTMAGALGGKIPLDASKVGDFQFVPVRFGQYMLMRGGRKVINETGDDYVFNFSNYLKSNGK